MMEIKLKAKRTSLILLIFICSCAKIKVNSPSPRFISPEAQGKLFSGQVRLEQQGGTEGTIDFENDALDNPLALRNTVSGPASSIDLGLLEKLDLTIKGNNNAATVYTLKYQILGESEKQAKAGNRSLAVSLGYGYEVMNENESDVDLFSSSKNTEAEVEQSILETSLIYGYRPHNDTLVYFSGQISKQDINFKLSSDNSALDGKSFSLNSWIYGLSLGARRDFQKSYFVMEVSSQNTNWTNNDPMTYAFINMAIGYKWN